MNTRKYKKIIITYDDNISDIDAIIYVKKHMECGKISKNNTVYSYGIGFPDDAYSFCDTLKTGTLSFRLSKK